MTFTGFNDSLIVKNILPVITMSANSWSLNPLTWNEAPPEVCKVAKEAWLEFVFI
jgi:hypothetical protein